MWYNSLSKASGTNAMDAMPTSHAFVLPQSHIGTRASHVRLNNTNRYSLSKRIPPTCAMPFLAPTRSFTTRATFIVPSRTASSTNFFTSRSRPLLGGSMSTAPPSTNVSHNAPTTSRVTPLPGKWSIVAAASIVHALHAAAVYMLPSTLLSPMRHALGLTVAEMTRPLIAYRVVQTLFLLPAGLVLDALGPQRCLRVAMAAAALSAPLLPLATSLPQIVTLQVFYALTKLIGGLSAMLLIVTSAFPDQAGIATATSVLLSGYSLAGFLAPAVIGSLSEKLGWRAASMLITVFFAITSVPLTFFFLKENPSSQRRPSISELLKQARRSIHLYTSRQPPSSSSFLPHSHLTDQQTPQRNVTELVVPAANGKLKEALFPAPYVLVAISVFAFSFSMHIVFDHLLVFLTEDFGLPFNKATLYISVLNLVALVSKLAIGPIADRQNKSLLLAIFGALAAISCFLLLDFSMFTFQTTSSSLKVIAFVIFYSIGYAAVFSLTTSVLPEFGKAKLGFRSNFNLMLLFASGSLGSYIAAALRSTTGSYKWPFLWNGFVWLFVVLAALAKYFLYDRCKHAYRIIPVTKPIPNE